MRLRHKLLAGVIISVILLFIFAALFPKLAAYPFVKLDDWAHDRRMAKLDSSFTIDSLKLAKYKAYMESLKLPEEQR